MSATIFNHLPPPPPGRTGWPWTAEGPDVPGGAESLPSMTLVTPVLNQAGFIEETIRSVLAQGYANLEYIIIDGGSSDGTVAVIGKYEPWLSAWVSEPDAGQSDAIRKGMLRSEGELCNWLCADDILTPGALRTVGRHFAEHPQCRWLAGAGDFLDVETGAVTRCSAGLDGPMALLDYWRYGMAGHYAPQPSTFWRGSLWEQVGGVRVSNHLAMDFELWLQFEQQTPLSVLDEVLSVSKLHPSAKSHRRKRAQRRQLRRCALAAAPQRGISPLRVLWRKLYWTLAWRLARLAGKELR